ncbi:MAG: cupin domain-containing protein [Elusimicrobiota bacterium]
MTADELVRLLELKPHPEGGFYRETYRAPGVIARIALPGAFDGPRPYSTSILYLLPEGSVSRLHRLRSDELWHYHLGGPLTVCEFCPDGRVLRTALGPDPRAGQRLQHAVEAGRWFGAEPARGAGFCLVGATVSPGFDFRDFEMARREELLARHPSERDLVLRLT